MTTVSAPFQVSSSATTQSSPHVAGLSDGRQVVTWIDGLSAVRSKVLNADGSVSVAETIVNLGQHTSGNVGNLGAGDFISVTGLPNGGWVVAWQYRNGSDENIFYRVFDATGGGGSILSAHAGYTNGQQTYPDVTWTNTGFAITWEDTNAFDLNAGNLSVMVETFDFSGGSLGLSQVDVSNAFSSDISFAGGRRNTVWVDTTGVDGIYGQDLGGVGAYRADKDVSAGVQPYYVADPASAFGQGPGGPLEFMTVWSQRSTFAEPYEVWGSFNGDGSGAFRVSTTPVDADFTNAIVAGLSNGGWIVAWLDGGSDAIGGTDWDVIVQLFDASHAKIGGEIVVTTGAQVNNNLNSLDIDTLSDGRALVTWEAGGPGTNGTHIYGSYIDPRSASGVVVTGGNDADQFVGTGGNDTLVGAGGNDTLTGGGGNDTLDGGEGADVLRGGIGQDIYICNAASDQTIEDVPFLGGGVDTVRASTSWTLAPSIENLELTGTGNFNGNGNAANNVITGNDANNVLNGLGGNDRIFGKGGSDTLNGGLGNDTLNGGLGVDFFVFTSKGPTNRDTITDFFGPQDTIRLENAVFNKITGLNTLSSAQFFTGAAAHDLNDRIIYNRATGVLLYDADGNKAGGVAAVVFATLSTKPALTHSDFFII